MSERFIEGPENDCSNIENGDFASGPYSELSSMLRPQRSWVESRTSSCDHAEHFKQCEEVLQSFKRFKIAFIVLCVMNGIIIVAVVGSLPGTVSSWLSQKSDNPGGTGSMFKQDTVSKTEEFQICVERDPLEQKFGNLQIMDEIQDGRGGTLCCFRNAEEILDFMFQFISRREKTSENRNTDVLRMCHTKGNANTSGCIVPTKPHIHLTNGGQTTDNSHVVGGWQLAYRKRFELHSHGKIIVLENGYFFLYSHLHFGRCNTSSEYDEVSHYVKLRSSGTGNSKIMLKTTHQCNLGPSEKSSRLEGILHLRTNDELTLQVSHTHLIYYSSQWNYFGMFKL